jgi:hypothetical protein
MIFEWRPFSRAAFWAVAQLCTAAGSRVNRYTIEEMSQMSAKNGDKARYYRLRKKKLLCRELQVKLASRHKGGSPLDGSSEKREPSTA